MASWKSADAFVSGAVALVPAELIVSDFQHLLAGWDFDLLESAITQKRYFRVRHES
jgi:hypothetical protein